jgi:predicted solute-binding protein
MIIDKIQDKVQAKAQFDQVYAKLIDLQASFEMPMQRMNDYLKNINDNLEGRRSSKLAGQ